MPNLVHFHEMPPGEQERLWAAATDYFALETEIFAGRKGWPNLEALGVAVVNQELIPVYPNENFGLVAPIRDRYGLRHLSDDEASIPYLRPFALGRLVAIAADCQDQATAMGFRDELAGVGFTAFRIAITSLTRSSYYQELIAKAGRFARRRNGEDEVSVHELGEGIDVDHAAFYVTDEHGSERALNPLSPARDLEKLGRLLPSFRRVLRTVVQTHTDEGNIIALHEIPDGWGVYHAAALPA